MKLNKNTADLLLQCAAENFALYVCAHIAHINITGRNFYSDHKLLGKIYQDFQDAIDVFGEQLRVYQLQMPQDIDLLLDCSTIAAGFTGESLDSDSYLEILYEKIEAGIETAHELIAAADDGDCPALSNFAQERVTVLGRHCWMLRAVLNADDYS